MRKTLLLLILSLPAAADDFWAHWGDGKAELNGYRLTQPRYGEKRAGTAVLVYVTEDFSGSLRVKAESSRHPQTDVYPVLKLNAVRDFQTGIYDYNVMTSVFARIAPGWPLAKLSFSSQEWCGHVWHQLLPRGGVAHSVRHSYFDGEADAEAELPIPPDGVFGDVLPILLRGWGGEYLKPGESRSVAYLPSLLSRRLGHKALAWSRATIARDREPRTVEVPAGRFEVVTWTVAVQGGPTTTFLIESRPPFRLVRWTTDDGEDAALLGSTRQPYWRLNKSGGEKYLKEMGLPVPVRTP